jgi:Carboxypeptidase regulatory-like domain
VGSTQRRLHHAAVLASALLLPSVFLTTPVLAQSLTLGFGGDGVYPLHCSINSQRWFRVTADRAAATTALTNLDIDGGISGGPFNPGLIIVPDPRPADSLDGVASYPGGGYRTIYTLGPFTGADFFPVPSPHMNWCMGTFGVGSGTSFTFHAVFWPQGATSPTLVDAGASFYTAPDDTDILEWYQSPAAGIDPLTVTPNQMDPDNDNGAADSTYTFRVQYNNGRDTGVQYNMPPRWGADAGIPGPFANRVNFDLLPEAPPTAADAPMVSVDGDYSDSYPWTMTRWDDWWMDQTGDWVAIATTHGQPPSGFRQYEAQVRAEIALIIDGNINTPHFMLRENPADSNFLDGVIYRYTIQPTDFENFLDNMFQLRYDPPGDDTQDTWVAGIHGTPVSNGYTSLSTGQHSYEFWATDDFHPPRGVAHVQVGWPGNQIRVEYLHPRPYVRVVTGSDRWWVRDGFGGDSYQRYVRPYGYPYDSMLHPTVNPALTAFPRFPQGSVGEGNVAPLTAVGGQPRLVPTMQYRLFNSGTTMYDLYDVVSPFEPYLGPGGGPEGGAVGGRPRQPTHYTNDDTIRPNYANIWDQSSATPFRGGKWTQSTQFTFLVNYWRTPSLSPEFIQVRIRRNDRGSAPGAWTSYTMQQIDGDTNYSDGAVFQFLATPEQLPGGGGPGDYNYYFVASDGTRSTIFPNRPPLYTDSITTGQFPDWDPLLPGNAYAGTGIPQADMGVPVDPTGSNDYYTFRVNHPPTLDSNDVTPASGRVGADFLYTVTYRDTDGQLINPAARGDEPFAAYIWIDLFGDPEGMNHVASVSAGKLNYTTETGTGYPAGSLVNATRPFIVRIEEAANPGAVGLQYRITANDTTSITATPIPPALGLGVDPISAGDRFEILQWFQGTMSKVDPTDLTALDGIRYQFSTANLITLKEGTHRYYFQFVDDWGDWVYPDDIDVSVEGETVRFPQASEFEGPEVLKNTAPVLTNYRFTPDAPGTGPDGTTATGFVFFVTYSDKENDPPALIRLGIDGTADTPAQVLDMTQSDPSDTVYSDGAVFETPPIELAAGDHIFRAQATDGDLRYPPTANPNDPLPFSGPPNPSPPPPRLDSVKGPKVAQNTPPTLVFPTNDAPGPTNPSPGLDPDAGTSQTTFTYTIIYKDTDVYAGVQGNPPIWVRVYIDGAAHDMTPVDPNDQDYTDGATFQFQITNLVAGTAHSYYFLANDGRDTARRPPLTSPDKQYPGPKVDEPPGPPKSLVVSDVPNDQGGAVEGSFNPSNDDGGGANDVTEYRIYRGLDSAMTSPVLALTVSATGQGSYPFNDDKDSLSPPPKNVDLWYVVRAWDGTNESIGSNIAGPVDALDNIAPAPPTNVAVTNPGLGRQLDVTWTKSADDGGGANDVVEYRVFRRTSSTPFVQLTPSVPAGTTTFTDTTVTDGVDYFYVVRAFDGVNESVDSNEAGPVQSTDTKPPILSDFAPLPGARDVPTDTTIAFSATDSGAGVDAASLDLIIRVGNQTVAGTIAQTPITNGFRFEFTPSAPFKELDVVNVHIEISDLAVPNPRTVTKDYRFTINPPPSYSISGTILTDQTPPQPLEGVTVYAGVLSAMTNAAGQYVIAGLVNGAYEVRPDKRGYAFQPTAVNVTIQDADVPGIDFVASQGFDISGRVTLNDRGLAGVRVSNDLKEAVTDDGGRYRIQDSPAGTYVVRPTLPGYAFTPADRQVTLGPAATGVDFEADLETFSVQGTVSTSDGGRLADAQVIAVRDGRRRASTHTDANGAYTLTGLVAGVYTISVTEDGYIYEPESIQVTLGPSSINNDFVAFAVFSQSYAEGLAFAGVPVVPQDPSVSAAFQTDQIARWDPTRSGFNKYVWASAEPNAPILQLAPGRGFFVYLAGPITVEVAGALVQSTDPFSIELESGFNMAANPYPVPLPWSKLAITPDGPVNDFGFLLVPGTRTYELVSDIPELRAQANVPRGTGFWIHSDSATILTSNPPVGASGVTAEKPRAPKIDAGNWVIPVVASGPSAADLSSRAGILAAAKERPESFQVLNPPTGQGTVDVYFLNEAGERLACDLRPTPAARYTWSFAVWTDLKQAPITLRLPDLSQVPANMRVTLVDVDAGKQLYGRTLAAYRYSSGEGGERRFRLEIAPEAGGNLVVSAATAQQARAGVSISYTLSKRASISVQVINVSGRRVATVARNQAVGAGRNTSLWNLQGEGGVKVPAGTYMVVIDAVAADGQRAHAMERVTVER